MTGTPSTPVPDSSDLSRRTLDFGGLSIEYDDRVLEPRPWTTAQSRWMADLLRRLPSGPVLELCSGAGHIGLLAAAYTGRDVVLVDASPAACELAERNARANPVSGSVQVRPLPMDEAIGPDDRFVGIIADPPWVPSERTSTFPDDPLSAIDGGADGLDLARLCAEVIDRHLLDGGAAVLQLGSTAQAASIGRMLASDDGTDLEVVETRSYGDRGVLVHLARREGTL